MKKLSAKISRRNLPMFGHQPQKEYSSIDEKQILSGKAIAEAPQKMKIFRERGMDLKTIISHDLFSMSPIFEGKLTAHAEKKAN